MSHRTHETRRIQSSAPPVLALATALFAVGVGAAPAPAATCESLVTLSVTGIPAPFSAPRSMAPTA